MSFVCPIITNCVYSANTARKTAPPPREEIAETEAGAGTVSEREVKGEIKGLGTNRIASSVSSVSVVIETMTY